MRPHHRIAISGGGILLCLLLLPAMHLASQHTSVLWGPDYEPWVLQLGSLYSKCGFYILSFIGAPLVITLAIVQMIRQRSPIMLTVVLLASPFLIGVLIQYLIDIQVDKYARYPEYGVPFPWRNLLDVSLIWLFGRLACAYAIACASIYLLTLLLLKLVAARPKGVHI
jgi:hypothetical protein